MLLRLYCTNAKCGQIVPLQDLSHYRKGIKYTLSIRNSTNNLESCRAPLSVQIKKCQLHFWKTLLKHFNDNPENPLKKIIEKAELVNTKYISYYKNLANLYDSPKNCQKILVETFCNTNNTKIRTKAAADRELKNVDYQVLYEPDRITISRYRTGSHNLFIETGRMHKPVVPRDERLCSCSTEI